MVSTHGTSQKVYKERALILNTIFVSVIITIDCMYNVNQLVTKLLMQDTLSYEIFQQCSTCEWINQEKITIVKINTNPIYQYGAV